MFLALIKLNEKEEEEKLKENWDRGHLYYSNNIKVLHLKQIIKNYF